MGILTKEYIVCVSKYLFIYLLRNIKWSCSKLTFFFWVVNFLNFGEIFFKKKKKNIVS